MAISFTTSTARRSLAALITSTALMALAPAALAQPTPMPGACPDGAGNCPHMMHHHGHMKNRMQMIDVDKDGSVSKAEFMANAEKKFERMDTNKDGKINAQDRKGAGHEYMKKPVPTLEDPSKPAAPAAKP
jgi:hypothetical protein